MRILCILIFSSLLSGCADVAMSGAQAVYNKRSIQRSINDQYQTLQAYRAIHTDPFKETNITISTFNDEMLVAGQVPEMWQKMQAERLIKQATDVDEIHNALAISNPSSLLTRLSDSWITAKIKAKLIASNDVDATAIRVITENGVVYLMGIMPKDEADEAIAIASDTQGVTRVVKVFRYIKIYKA